MPNKLEIKKLDSSHVSAIIALWERAGLPFKPRGRDLSGRITRAVDSGSDCFFGAFSSGELAGAVLVTHDGRKGWINRLAVDASLRRKGLGRALIERAEKYLLEQKIEIYAALIEDYNQPSLELFKACGYVLHKDIYYLSKREHSDV